MKARINFDKTVVAVTVPGKKDLKKLAKRYKVPLSVIQQMYMPRVKEIKWTKFLDDSVVKLNYDHIMSKTEGLSQNYLDWVEEHKDMELHVYQDEEHKDSQLYCIREDTNQSPWLFDISELELVTMAETSEFVISNDPNSNKITDIITESDATVEDKNEDTEEDTNI